MFIFEWWEGIAVLCSLRPLSHKAHGLDLCAGTFLILSQSCVLFRILQCHSLSLEVLLEFQICGMEVWGDHHVVKSWLPVGRKLHSWCILDSWVFFSLSVTFEILLIWKQAAKDGVVVSWQQQWLCCYFQLCAIFSDSEQKLLLL